LLIRFALRIPAGSQTPAVTLVKFSMSQVCKLNNLDSDFADFDALDFLEQNVKAYFSGKSTRIFAVLKHISTFVDQPHRNCVQKLVSSLHTPHRSVKQVRHLCYVVDAQVKRVSRVLNSDIRYAARFYAFVTNNDKSIQHLL